MVRAIAGHLRRSRSTGSVGVNDQEHGFMVTYPRPAGSILIIVPTRNRADLLRTCLDSVWRTCGDLRIDIVVIDHQSDETDTTTYLDSIKGRVEIMPYSGAFNFARMNNVAFERFGRDHDFVLFMNNDIEAIEPGWLGRIASLAAREEIGIVGANLIYADRRIQHSGVVVGLSGAADHAHRYEQLEDFDGNRRPGRDHSLASTREYSAVTAACMIMRCEVFRAVQGFDEELAIGFNDTDLCLRVRESGYRILNDGRTVLYHHESATRARSGELDHPRDTALFVSRWRSFLAAGDPAYNPQLSQVTAHRPGTLRDARFPARVWFPRSERRRSPVTPRHAPRPTVLS
ncbi:hypothetical protein BZG35_03835 [Brevundimonas sp. LM2]|nr:hypothetical protein BZG35_03835 [Brevundimonas sp. LM2]